MVSVLILDSDLGFVFWLGQGLDAAGYEAFPAKTVIDARALLEKLKLRLDVLVVNPGVTGAAGFLEKLRSQNDRLKVIAVTDDPAIAQQMRADLRCPKPRNLDYATRANLIGEFERVLPPFHLWDAGCCN